MLGDGLAPADVRWLLRQRVRAGANWFFLVAAASLARAAAQGLDAPRLTVISSALGTMTAGVWSAFVLGLAGAPVGQAGPLQLALAVVATLPFAGLISWLGYCARQGRTWAFIAGAVLYGLDSVILVLAGIPELVMIRALCLVGILVGLQALRRLESLPVADVPLAEGQSHVRMEMKLP